MLLCGTLEVVIECRTSTRAGMRAGGGGGGLRSQSFENFNCATRPAALNTKNLQAGRRAEGGGGALRSQSFENCLCDKSNWGA